MKKLYDRYRILPVGVSIFQRSAPRWQKSTTGSTTTTSAR